MQVRWWFLALLLWSALQAEAQFASGKMAIKRVESDFVRAALDGEWSDIIPLFAPDAVLIPASGPAVTGNREISQWFAASGTRSVDFVLTSAAISVDGTIGTDRGTFRLSSIVGGKRLTATGNYVWILRKDDKGHWRISIDMFASTEPAPSD